MNLTPGDLRCAVTSLICAVMCGSNLVAQAITQSVAPVIFGACFAVLSYLSWRGIGRA